MAFKLPWFRRPAPRAAVSRAPRSRMREGQSVDDFRHDRVEGYQGRSLMPGEHEVDLTPEERRRAVQQSRRVYGRCAVYGAVLDRLADFVYGDGVVFKVKGEAAQKALDDVLNHPENKFHELLKPRLVRFLIDGEFVWSLHSAQRSPAQVPPEDEDRSTEATLPSAERPEKQADGPAHASSGAGATPTAEIRIGRLAPDGIEGVSVSALNHDRIKGITYRHGVGGEAIFYPNAEADVPLVSVTRKVEVGANAETVTVGPVLACAAFWRIHPLSTRSGPLLTRIIDKADTLDEAVTNAARKVEYVNRFYLHVKYKKAGDESRGEKSADLAFEKKVMDWATSWEPGAALVTGQDVEVGVQAPDLKLLDMQHLYDILIGWILGAHGIPRMWYSDGGDTNRATAAEQGTPIHRSIRSLQAYWSMLLENLVRCILWWLAQAGVKGVTGEEEIDVVTSDVATRDSERDVKEITGIALALNELVAAQIITPAERIAIGRDVVASKPWGDQLNEQDQAVLEGKKTTGLEDIDPRNPVPTLVEGVGVDDEPESSAASEEGTLPAAPRAELPTTPVAGPQPFDKVRADAVAALVAQVLNDGLPEESAVAQLQGLVGLSPEWARAIIGPVAKVVAERKASAPPPPPPGTPPVPPGGAPHPGPEDEPPAAGDAPKGQPVPDKPPPARTTEGYNPDQPRGQPENAGQFGPGGGVKKAPDAPKGGSGDAPDGDGSDDSPRAEAQTAEQHWDSLADEDRKLTRNFTGFAFRKINACARDGQCEGTSKADVARLQAVIEGAPKLDRPATVYRGIGGPDVEKMIGSAKPGEVITMSGFQSTSSSKKIASKFAAEAANPGEGLRGSAILVIKTNRGLQLSGKGGAGHEKELLLGHGWKYRVAKVTSGEQPVIHLEVV